MTVNPIPSLRADSLPVRHGFFTRAGGVSTGPYASLNGSLSGGDDPVLVSENRRRVAQALGASTLLGLTQIHSADVVTATQPWAEGQGARADALVTALPGVALGVITADCAPVLFASEDGRVVGAAHAGWAGALAGVLQATAAAMRALGAGRIAAAIGPCIRQTSYEVGGDLRDRFLADDPAHTRFFTDGRPGHWQFDLAGFCAACLAAVDVAAEIVPADTLPDEARFFSHRRRTLSGGGKIGHQISAICA